MENRPTKPTQAAMIIGYLRDPKTSNKIKHLDLTDFHFLMDYEIEMLHEIEQSKSIVNITWGDYPANLEGSDRKHAKASLENVCDDNKKKTIRVKSQRRRDIQSYYGSQAIGRPCPVI